MYCELTNRLGNLIFQDYLKLLNALVIQLLHLEDVIIRSYCVANNK